MMNRPTSRRDWLRQLSLGLLATSAVSKFAAMAADPIVRNGKPHLKLSLAAYSFNSLLLKSWTPEQLPAAKFTLEQFLDFCAAQNLDACELTAYYFPKSVTNEYLLGLKERAFRLGLDISGTAIGNDFCVADPEQLTAQLETTRKWIDISATLGAPVIRIFAGKVPKGDTEETAVTRCVAAIDEAVAYAAGKGVALALENHGGITATPEQLLRIVKAVKPSPYFGINFDSGNFRTADPYGDLAKIAPYALNAQIKVEMFPGGKKEPTDIPRVIEILKSANYRGYVALEYEAAEDPFAAIPGYVKQLRQLVSA